MVVNRSITARAFCIALFFSAPSAVSGQAQGDVCRVALESNALNTFDQTVSNRIAFEQKEELCRRNYSSAEEFRNSARSGGFNLSYAGVGLGASGGRSSGEGRVHFREEAFCRASQQDFFQEYQSTTSVRIGDVALRAWSECIRTTNENSLWLHYTVQPDGTGMTGTLRRTIRTGPTNLRITSMQVQPDYLSDEVRCIVAGRMFTPRSLSDGGPIETQTTSEIVSCTKPHEQTVRVALATDGGSLTWITMPSAQERHQTEVESLEAQLSELKLQVLELQRRRYATVLRSEQFESDSSRDFSIVLERPGLLFATAHGSASISVPQGAPGRPNGQVRTRILVNQRHCAGDYIYYSPVSRIRFEVSATCVQYLEAGTHAVRLDIEQNSMENLLLRGSLQVLDVQR